MLDVTVIGERLRTARHAKHLSQMDVAARIGFSPRAYQSWERNEFVPTLYGIAEAAACLGVSLDYLVGLTDNPDK